jgi:drug/metabolite transporter (DMT)-like permease
MLQKGFLDIFILAMLWGPSFLFIKIASKDVQPLSLVCLRVSFGCALLYSLCKLKQIRFPKTLTLWKHGLILGFFLNGLPFICFNFAMKTIPTSLGSLINGITPILTVILANIFLADEKITLSRSIGILIGLSGFAILFIPKLLSGDANFDLFGMFLALVASLCYAIGMVYAKKHVQKAPPLVMPIIQLLSSLIYLIPLACYFEGPIHLLDMSMSSAAAISGLAILGTMLAYIVYYRIILHHGATAVSMVTYLLPVIGTLLGMIFLNEKINAAFYIASILILVGLMVMNGNFTIFRKIMSFRYTRMKIKPI